MSGVESGIWEMMESWGKRRREKWRNWEKKGKRNFKTDTRFWGRCSKVIFCRSVR
jgi:hypothetical protein